LQYNGRIYCIYQRNSMVEYLNHQGVDEYGKTGHDILDEALDSRSQEKNKPERLQIACELILPQLRQIDSDVKKVEKVIHNSEIEEIKEIFMLLQSLLIPDSLPTNVIHGLLESFVRHDMKGIEQVFIFLQLIQTELQKDKPNVSTIQIYWASFLVVWNRYNLLAQDITARYVDGEEVDESFVENTPLALILSEVESFIIEKNNNRNHRIMSGSGTVVNYSFDVSPEATDIVLQICPGVLFNKLRNILMNPIDRDSIQAKNVSMKVFVDGNELVITVGDDGKGMTKEVQQSIFKEGFTGNDGKGLGLAQADILIASMGGSIQVTSEMVSGEEIGNGTVHTTFEIRFPILKKI